MTKTTFAERYQAGVEASIRKPELKALKKTPLNAEYVIMKVTGKQGLKRYGDRGWELMTPVVSLFNASGTYLMRKPRNEV